MKKLILSLIATVGIIAGLSAQETFTNNFSFTGSFQTFLVPDGVTSITFDLIGASGGDGNGGGWFVRGGAGGEISGILSVDPSEYLYIFVGGFGQSSTANPVTGGFNGGGNGSYLQGGAGGGATDIRIGGFDLTNRVAVAGGGGGGNTVGGFGGVGGNLGLTMNVLGQGGSGTYGGGGGGYYGGYYAGPPAGVVSNGQGGSNWSDPLLVSDAVSNGGGASFNTANGSVTISYSIQSVPEPSTYALFGLGAIGLLMVMRRKKAA